MKLILMRHGETVENSQGIMQGQLPGQLSQQGIYQAQSVALELKDECIDVIYSSDLKRSVDTANEVLKYHPNIKINFVKDLRERNVGEFQGKSMRDIDILGKNFTATKVDPKDGESLDDLYNRAKHFLNQLIENHSEDCVLCAGHDGINKAILSAMFNKGPRGINTIDNQYNTSLNVFEINKGEIPKITELNNTDHLK